MYVVNSVNQAERELSSYNEHVRDSLDHATGVINHSINTSLSAYELQGQIDQLYTRYKHVELANKKIRTLNNKKFYDFNTYRTVRKIVQGMMDNLDLHMGREEAAVKWFLEYQRCDLKGSDENTFLMLFSLISKTLSDTVDEETCRLIFAYIHRLIAEGTEKAGYREEQVIGVIRQRMQNLMQTEAYELPLLATYCKDYSTIVKMLNLAKNNSNILEFILKVVHVPVAEKNTYLKEYLNELLEKPNSVEIATYNETIIRMGGDVKAAKEVFDREIERRESELNIISSMIGWIYDMGNEDINGQMRLNMFTLLKRLEEKAADSYFQMYRNMYRDVHPVQILDYASEADFSNESGEIQKAESFYEEQQRQEMDAVKNTSAYIAFGVGALCGAAAFFTDLLLLTGLGIGVCVGAGLLAANSFKKKNIALRIQKSKTDVTDILHKLFGEYGDMTKLYRELDGVSEKIVGELAKL